MPAQLLEGKPVADAVLVDVRQRVAALRGRGITAGLATILVGDDSASTGYVRKKEETSAEVGIAFLKVEIPSTGSQTDLMAAVHELNANPDVHGFIIQHPVPAGFDLNQALLAMEPAKDADGLHPVNLGKLVLQEQGPVPCTPAGIVAMLDHYGLSVSGKEVVVVGRGPTLGRPLTLLLTLKRGANAAVTTVHTGVQNIADYTRRADCIIAAVGVPSFVTADMVSPGTIVISWEGKKLLADVDESVAEVAAWITPRLGGVGPTTVAMLLRNTVAAAEHRAP